MTKNLNEGRYCLCNMTGVFLEAVMYTIIVETGTSFGAGTDYNIEIRLHGISRKTGLHGATSRLKLDKSQNHANKFERGK